MKFDLKWIQMARYELILRLVRGIWLRIILKPLLTPKRPWNDQVKNKVKDILAKLHALCGKGTVQELSTRQTLIMTSSTKNK